MDIPLKINYAIGNNKWRLITSLGITTSVFLKETITSCFYYTDHTDKKLNPYNYDFNTINFSPTLSIGADYKMNNKMNLRVEPTFRYGVTKIISTPVTGNLYNGGLNIGYYYAL
jgi:hypothetical protein